MKIAFVGGFAFSPKGTIQARAFPIASELVSQGHEVTIFLAPYDNLQDSGKQWIQEGVRIRNVRVGATPLSYPYALAQLLNGVEGYRPDVVHVFKPKGFAGAAGTYLLLKGRHPMVVDCDDWEGWGGWNEVKPYPWILKEYIDRQERWMMRRAPVVTVASRGLQTRVCEVRAPLASEFESNVFYVPNCGASNGKIVAQRVARARSQSNTRRALGLPEGLLILYSGHFEPGEDAAFFCRAAAPVVERNQATILFVGEGPDLALTRSFFSAWPRVKTHFLPRLSYGQFMEAIWAADVAAFPFPDNPIYRAKCSARILDYMAMGKPVITSAVGQNSEYIVDGESGLLTKPDDEVAFAEKLELLLKNPDLRSRLGGNAAERVGQKFNWNAEPLQQCLAAYRQTAAQN